MTTVAPAQDCPVCQKRPVLLSALTGGGGYTVECRNHECPAQPRTTAYETAEEAIAEWNSIQKPAAEPEPETVYWPPETVFALAVVAAVLYVGDLLWTKLSYVQAAVNDESSDVDYDYNGVEDALPAARSLLEKARETYMEMIGESAKP